jgi:hypothetical protein
MKKPLIFIIFFVLVSGCISEFYPTLKSDNEYLIIDARITDKEGAFVKLSTIKGGETSSQMLAADVSAEIDDDSGGRIVLTKTSQGVYTSNINGIPGKSYTLHIITTDGNIYSSSTEIMYSESSIDSIYPAFEFHPDYNSKLDKPGAELYVDFNTINTQSKYFRWTYDETWIEKTPYRWIAYGTWDKNGNMIGINYWPGDTEHNRKCFHYSSSNEVVIKSTELITPGPQKRNSLFFVNDLSGRFSIGYSVELKQYSLTPNAFLYFTQLQKTSELTGSLYDPIPSFIESNIYNVNDPLQKITGFFMVSGLSKKRIFINPIDVIPGKYLSGPGSQNCQDSIANSFAEAARIHKGDYFLNIYSYTPSTPFSPMVINISNSTCFDCTSNGGSTIRPAYWDDRYSGN